MWTKKRDKPGRHAAVRDASSVSSMADDGRSGGLHGRSGGRPHKQPIGIDAGGKLVPAVLLKVGSLVHWGKEVTSQYAEIHRWITNGGSSASDPNPAGLSYAVGTADFADCVTGLPLAVEDAHFAACSSWPGSCCSKPAALATCCPCVPATVPMYTTAEPEALRGGSLQS